MQFYKPEVLYALVLLIIPIIVHLFQLRKFQTEYFTNVKFLKKLSLQTRKSSRLKKWLVLTTRLLALSAIILAFAQPYIPTDEQRPENVEAVIFLDNSYSMQAKGKKGRLLERSIQELLESDFSNKNISLYTNSEEFEEITTESLQNISFSGELPDYKTILLKSINRFSKDSLTLKKILLISDFQKQFEIPQELAKANISLYTYPLKPESRENIQIDTAFLSSEDIDSRVLKVKINNTGKNSQSIPVSLYNYEKLLGKTSVTLDPDSGEVVTFPITDSEILKGKIQIEDNGLAFDNNIYFSLNKTAPLKVCSINLDDNDFLGRIYTEPEFKYDHLLVNSLDYNLLNASDVIILNEVPEISAVLATNLSKLIANDKVLIVIPTTDKIGSNFLNFTKGLGIVGYDNKQEQEKLISNINFQHPLYKGVFEQQVKNFEYPKVQTNYMLKSGSNAILSLQDSQAFLLQKDNLFVFSSSLNLDNSNFIKSPLVVPTFYKMALTKLSTPPLYFNLGKENKISVPLTVKNDEIVRLTSDKISFIPQQKSSEGRIEITTTELPNIPDNYLVNLKDVQQLGISYNVDREESNLLYPDLGKLKNVEQIENLNEFFISEGYVEEKNTFWKWFVTFALLFLIIEMLLLKYLK